MKIFDFIGLLVDACNCDPNAEFIREQVSEAKIYEEDIKLVSKLQAESAKIMNQEKDPFVKSQMEYRFYNGVYDFSDLVG